MFNHDVSTFNLIVLCLQPSSQVQKAKISPSSAEYVLDQLSQCEEKLLKLVEEVDQNDESRLLDEMDQEDVSTFEKYNLPLKLKRYIVVNKYVFNFSLGILCF